MYVIGDIGNTETKICLFNNKKKLLKKKIFNTVNTKNINLYKNFNFIFPYSKKIKKVVFSSVVPEVFNNIKRLIKKEVSIAGKISAPELQTEQISIIKKKIEETINGKEDQLQEKCSTCNNLMN